MTEFRVVPTDLTTASQDTADAAATARGSDGADALATLGRALPGSGIADVAREVGPHWRDGVDHWSDSAQDLAAAIETTRDEAASADDRTVSVFDLLAGAARAAG